MSFSARGSPVTYAVAWAGCPWMASWQARQTMRVLRRILAIFAAQAGCPGPGYGVVLFRVLLPHQQNPAEPVYQVRLAVTLDPGFEARAQPVRCLDLGLVPGRGLGHRGLVLGAQGLQHGRLGVPAQRAEPPDVAGEQVVAGDAPVLGPVDPDDVVVVQVQQGCPAPGFAVAPVWGPLGPDHVERHAQRDAPVGRAAASGDLAIGVPSAEA